MAYLGSLCGHFGATLGLLGVTLVSLWGHFGVHVGATFGVIFGSLIFGDLLFCFWVRFGATFGFHFGVTLWLVCGWVALGSLWGHFWSQNWARLENHFGWLGVTLMSLEGFTSGVVLGWSLWGHLGIHFRVTLGSLWGSLLK